MRSLQQSRSDAGRRQPLTLRSVAVAVGIGLLLAAGLLISVSACGAGPTIPDRYLYVTNQLDNTLSVIDGSTYHVIATVPVGALPAGVAVSPDGRDAYIAQGGDHAVSVFDTSTNTITTTVALPAGSSPRGVALTPNGQLLYIADGGGSNSVSVLDTRTNQIVASVPVGSQPVSVTVTPDGGSVYVTNELSGNVTVINTRNGAVEATLPSGIGPFSVATSPTDNSVYVATVSTGKSPYGVAAMPGHAR
jgi:YVTN family beta-propeller protein